MDSWLVRSTPVRAVPVQALTGDISLCPWARPLDFKEHVKIICKSAFFRIRSIAKIRRYLSQSSTETIAYIKSRLDYSNVLLYSLPKYLINKLQLLQNSAAPLLP